MFNNDLTSLLLLPLVCNIIQVIILKILNNKDIKLPVLNMDRGDGWGCGRVSRFSKVTRNVHVVKKRRKTFITLFVFEFKTLNYHFKMHFLEVYSDVSVIMIGIHLR